MAINYRQCPDCGSKNTVRIFYGDTSTAICRKAEAGLIRLGDGDKGSDSPEYFCSDCEYEWNREQAVDAAYCGIKTVQLSIRKDSGIYYGVDVDFVHPAYVWRHGGAGSDNEEIHKSIRESTASQFADQLKAARILDWDTAYTKSAECRTADCTIWSLEIITGDKTIQKTGDNQYPEQWELFGREIEKLTGRNFEW